MVLAGRSGDEWCWLEGLESGRALSRLIAQFSKNAFHTEPSLNLLHNFHVFMVFVSQESQKTFCIATVLLLNLIKLSPTVHNFTSLHLLVLSLINLYQAF